MPEAIAHFKILESLGSGGLGDVYRARDTQPGTDRRAESPAPANHDGRADLLDALHATAVRLMQLSHPNIAMLFEIGQDEHRKFMVFEFVQGQPLGVADQRPAAAAETGAGVRHQPGGRAGRCARRPA